jgi:hypothetical protein
LYQKGLLPLINCPYIAIYTTDTFFYFKAMEDAESALMFNDVPFENVKLAVRRPKDYENALNPLVVKRGGVDSQAAANAISNARDKQALGGMVELPVGVVLDPKLNTEISLQAPPPIATEWGRVSRRVPDSKNKLYAGGFDPLHSETQVRQGTYCAFPKSEHCLMPRMECSDASLTNTTRAPENKTVYSLCVNRPSLPTLQTDPFFIISSSASRGAVEELRAHA